MKRLLNKELRKYYIDKLTGIEVNSTVIPVINLARINQRSPYIMILKQSQGEAALKSHGLCEMSITLQCVTSASGDFGGDEFADDVADAVIQKLFETPGDYGQTSVIKVVTCTVTSDELLRINTNTDLQIIRQLEITNYVEILN